MSQTKEGVPLEIRTQRGRLVGIFDEKTRVFCVKDRNKEMRIKIPLDGLQLQYAPGDGSIEEVYIPSTKDKSIVA